MSDTDTVEYDSTESSDSDGGAPTAVAVLTHIVKSIVDDPSAVTVEADDSGRRLTLNVRVGDQVPGGARLLALGPAEAPTAAPMSLDQ